MAQRIRKLDFSGLTGPASRGLLTEARAGENLASMILGAGRSIGGGIVRGRAEDESKRRFGIESARRGRAEARADAHLDLAQDRFGLEKFRHDEALRDKQAYRKFMGDLGTQATDAMIQTEGMDPGAKQAFDHYLKLAGGPEQAQKMLVERPP